MYFCKLEAGGAAASHLPSPSPGPPPPPPPPRSPPLLDASSSVLVHAGEAATQEDVFSDLKFVVHAALQGYNGTIMGRKDGAGTAHRAGRGGGGAGNTLAAPLRTVTWWPLGGKGEDEMPLPLPPQPPLCSCMICNHVLPCLGLPSGGCS